MANRGGTSFLRWRIGRLAMSVAALSALMAVCPVSTPGWQNTPMAAQDGLFTVEFDATPNDANIDGLMALSLGEGSTFNDYAVLIRFNENGFIDVRSGAVYSADLAISYAPGSSYHFRVVVDVPQHTYTTYVTPPAFPELVVAADSAFRTTQNTVGSLDNWGIWAGIGSHEVCNFGVSGSKPPIAPSSGWAGPTREPGPIGSPDDTSYDAKVIAHWDVVPYQTFAGDFEIGVVAFHINGIDRVEFAAEGGAWVTVTEMTLNPRTRVHEYWAELPASELDDGLVEVRAIVYPTIGHPRLLDSLWLNANAGGTLPAKLAHVSPTGSDFTGNGSITNPYATIAKAASQLSSSQGGNAGGGTIALQEGDYAWGGAVNVQDRWLTIRAGPGAQPQNVRITSTNGPFLADLTRLRQLTVYSTALTGRGGIWYDRCTVQGSGPDDASMQWIGISSRLEGNVYATDTHVDSIPVGIKNAAIQRGVLVTDVAGDQFRNSWLIVNCEVRYGPTGPHSDLFQWFWNTGDHENFIVYGVQAFDLVETQGIYGALNGNATQDNIAFVNLLIETEENPIVTSQWAEDMETDHLLLWNVTLVNQKFSMWADVTNLSVRGCCWHLFRSSADLSAADFRSNHYVDWMSFAAITPGEDVSIGHPLFVDPSNDDYRPLAISPLRERLDAVLVPVDAAGVKRTGRASVGAYEGYEP